MENDEHPSLNNHDLRRSGPSRLRPKKLHPGWCWVPSCKEAGEPYCLEYNGGTADVILCERHTEKALEAGQ